MSANRSNDWGVSFSRISWFANILGNHKSVSQVMRTQDIYFVVTRTLMNTLNILCLDEYVLGIAALQRALTEFPETNIIYVGGNWNSYTPEAKQYCLKAKIGLYNSEEINGALYREDFWTYHKKDDKGNPVYPFKSA